MKKRIFKIFVISLLLCVFLCLWGGCGYSPGGESYMKQYMNSIEAEYGGYHISNEQEDGGEKIVAIQLQLPANINVKEKSFGVDVLEGEEKLEGYTINIDNQTIEITVDYFKSHSGTFNKILKMWSEYNNETQRVQSIDIGPIFVFDDELFVCFSYRPPKWIADWRGKIPLILYRFDINDYSLQYVSYFDKYLSYGYICKNKQDD